MSSTIRVLLVDDQALIRSGFAALVGSAADMEVVGQAGDGAAAVALARAVRPDVVLMDLRMPGVDGMSATRTITEDPDLHGVRILVLTTFEDDAHVLQALRAGASGFLGKGVEPVELLEAVRVVASGDALLSPRATRALVERFARGEDGEAQLATEQSRALRAAFDRLTDRERELSCWAALGLSNDAIAERLVLSPLTAKTHLNRAMTKLGVRDRAQLVALAYQAGLVRPGDQRPRQEG